LLLYGGCVYKGVVWRQRGRNEEVEVSR